MQHLIPHYGDFENVAIPCHVRRDQSSCCIPSPHPFFRHETKPEDFFKFPQRHGWTVKPENYHLKRLENTSASSRGSVEQYNVLDSPEVFIQSWLFFCLIACVVRTDKPLLKVSQLITAVSGSKEMRLTTAELTLAVDEWRDWAKRNPLESKLRLIHTDLILQLARRVVRANLSEEMTRTTPLSVYPQTSLAIMILGETLSAAKLEIMESTGKKARGWHEDDNEGWGGSHFISERMKEISCAHVRKMLKIQMGSHVTLLLAATKHYPGAKHHSSHTACDEEQCRYIAARAPHNAVPQQSSTSDLSPYQPQCHTDQFDNVGDACKAEGCSMEGPDMEKLYKLLREANEGDGDVLFPVFRIKKQESGSVNVLVEAWPSNGRKAPFATISHVWSQGLGNEIENKVHRCQLDHIFHLLRLLGMPASETSDGVESPPFWLDTFAIPVKAKGDRVKTAAQFLEPEDFDNLKRRCIQGIYHVFNNSDHAIVIDRDLCKLPRAEKPTEVAMKLLTSSWMRRLWTLQEAFLSKRISVAFHTEQSPRLQEHDQLPGQDFDKLVHDLSQGNDSDTNTVGVSMSKVLARQLRENLMVSEREARNKNGDSVNGRGSMLIASAWRSVRWRSTSRREDETLALATLLNLDFGDRRRIPTAGGVREDSREAGEKFREQRQKMMMEFWQLVHQHWEGSIPSGMIFLPPPRLPIKGFGWSPETWMTGKTEDYPYALARMDHPTQLRPEGLLVRYPGIMLYSLDFISILANRDDTTFHFPIDRELNEWYSVTIIGEGPLEETVQAIQNSPRAPRTPKRFSLIMSRPRPKEHKEVALLVEVYTWPRLQREGDPERHEVYNSRIVTRVWVSRTTPKELADVKVIGELTDENQHWCVDGYGPTTSHAAFSGTAENSGGERASVNTTGLLSTWRLPFLRGKLPWEMNSNDKSGLGTAVRKSRTFHTGSSVPEINSQQGEPITGNLAHLQRANTSGASLA